MQRFRISCFVMILILPSFALSFSPKDDLTIALKERQIQELSAAGLKLVFYISITNSSSKTYYLSAYSYNFVVNQKEYLRLETNLEQRFRVDSGGETLIALPVKITYDLLFQAIPEIQDTDKAACYMMGELAFADERKERGRLPFGFSGEFPIFREPEFQLLSFDVSALTIGGADLALLVKIINSNGFELLPDSIRYNIAIGGHPIGGDHIRGDKSIESHAEKSFSLPLLLNFFEVGKDIYAFLQQDSVPCQFSGEIEIKTVWGRIAIAFDESHHIPVKKSSPGL
ncbi:MAG: LEA type 2 family protein [Candidatus Aminicenantes bacterium]|nr:LEA type 2 family protein [Candidatus Aminicenantes bacterium]